MNIFLIVCDTTGGSTSKFLAKNLRYQKNVHQELISLIFLRPFFKKRQNYFFHFPKNNR